MVKDCDNCYYEGTKSSRYPCNDCGFSYLRWVDKKTPKCPHCGQLMEDELLMTIPEGQKSCNNCKWAYRMVDDPQCHLCSLLYNNHWEEKEE